MDYSYKDDRWNMEVWKHGVGRILSFKAKKKNISNTDSQEI
jgi:hypothetical protein